MADVSSPQSPVASPTDTPPKRRPIRVVATIVGAVVIPLAALVVIAPVLVSTPRGTQFLLSFVNARIPGTMTIEDLNIGWFQGASLTGLSITDPDGTSVIKTQSLHATGLSFWSLLTGTRALGNIRMLNPIIRIEQFDDGSSNLDHIFAKPPTARNAEPTSPPGDAALPKRKKFALDRPLELDIVNGRVTLVAPDDRRVDVTALSVSVQALNLNAIRLLIKAEVSESGSPDKGKIDADVTLTHLFDRMSEAAGVEADIRIANVPTVTFGRLLGTNAKLDVLLGPVLHGTLTTHGTRDRVEASLGVRSENLVAQLICKLNEGQFEVNPKSHLHLTVQPGAFQLLTGGKDQTASVALVHPFTIELTIQRLSAGFVLSERRLDLSTLDAMLHLTSDDVVLDSGSRHTGRLTLAETSGELVFDSGRLQTMLESAVVHSGNTGGFTLRGVLSDLVDEDGQWTRNPFAPSLSSFQIRIHRWPLIFVDHLLHTQGRVTAVLGQSLDATIETDRPPESEEGSVTLTADTPFLHCRVVAQTEDDRIEIKPGPVISYSLQPGLWRKLVERIGPRLDGFADLELERPVDVTAHVDTLSIPYKGESSLFDDLHLHGKMMLGNVDLISIQEAGRLVLTNSSFTVDKDNELRATFDTHIEYAGPRGGSHRGDLSLELQSMRLSANDLSIARVNAQLRPLPSGESAPSLDDVMANDVTAGPMVCDTTIDGLSISNGQLNLARIGLITNTRLPKFPVAWLDAALGFENHLLAVVGPMATIELNGQFPGNLVFRLRSDTTSASASLLVTDQRELLLHEDITATLELTPPVARLVLGKIQPIFADAMTSDEPIRLTLPKQPFYLALASHDTLDSLTIDGTLHFGTLRMARRGWLRQSVEGISAHFVEESGSGSTKQRPLADVYLANFTPLHFHIDRGQMETSELWMTGSELAVGFQGKANMNEQTYKFMIGVLGRTLLADTTYHSIRDMIDPTHVYEVALHGRIGETPRVNCTPLVQELVGLGLKQQSNQQAPDTAVLTDLNGKPIQAQHHRKSEMVWHPPAMNHN